MGSIANHRAPVLLFKCRLSVLASAAAFATDVDGPNDCIRQLVDFGDAPEGVQAYPGIAGHFPTCVAGAINGGTQTLACPPISIAPGAAAGFVRHVTPTGTNPYWLGCTASAGAMGIDSESNGKVNDTGAPVSACATSLGIDCVEAAFGLSFGQDECYGSTDACLSSPITFSTCTSSSVTFTAYNCAATARTVYLNILVDWNQDGDWNDNFQCVGACAQEWAVKNTPIVLPPQCNTITSPSFPSGPNNGNGWMRISISDGPVPDDFPWNGSAGLAGQALQGGETEDYPVTIGHPNGECPPYRDFGDVPESVYAYPGILGHFPTCLFPSAPGTQGVVCAPISTPPGPTGYMEHIHTATDPTAFWLGCGGTGGFTGVDDEADGKTNDTGGPFSRCNDTIPIDCVQAAFGMSFGQDECYGDLDAGIASPLTFSVCSTSQVRFKANNCGATTQQVYLNILVDWNGDGDWNDNFSCPPGTQCAYEWAVKNQVILLAPGCQDVSSPTFLTGPFGGNAWLRISLTQTPVTDDYPWAGSAGLPSGFYQNGETEDYPVTISGNPCDQSYRDFGDAPEDLPAYTTGIVGHFPTCLAPGAPGTPDPLCDLPDGTPPGPTGYVMHIGSATSSTKFWLGCGAIGVDGEADGKVNIGGASTSACNPAVLVDCVETFGYQFGQDECYGDADAGIASFVSFARCSLGVVKFDAYNCGQGPVTVYLNILVDWNEDGDWVDNVLCIGNKRCAHEWAVKNVAIPLPPGCSSLISPSFAVGPKTGDAWMRVTLTPAPVNPDFPWAGSATEPNGSYQGGETEDYMVQILPSTVGVGDLLPGEMKLHPLAPNPSRSFTNVRFALTREADVSLAVYDVSGREMVELANGKWQAGEHSIKWNFTDGAGQAVPAGLYFVKLQAGGQVLMQRAIRLH